MSSGEFLDGQATGHNRRVTDEAFEAAISDLPSLISPESQAQCDVIETITDFASQTKEKLDSQDVEITRLKSELMNLRETNQSQQVTINALSKLVVVKAQECYHYKELADKDPLTGIYSRGGLYRAIDRLADEIGEDQAVIATFGDLDNFKPLNDEHTHDLGDEFLLTLAQGIQSAVGDQDIVCRYGGDEYALISVIDVKEDNPVERVDNTVKKVIDNVSNMDGKIWAGKGVGMTLAHSQVYKAPVSSDEIKAMLLEADKQMIALKRFNRTPHVRQDPRVLGITSELFKKLLLPPR